MALIHGTQSWHLVLEFSHGTLSWHSVQSLSPGNYSWPSFGALFAVGIENLQVVDPPWMPKLKTKVENLDIRRRGQVN